MSGSLRQYSDDKKELAHQPVVKTEIKEFEIAKPK